MGQPELPAALESGVLPSGRTSSDNSQFPDKAEVERLGRARPAVLTSWLNEVLFVATIVLSMTMSEYFIGGFNIILPPWPMTSTSPKTHEHGPPVSST
ncbi:hypothetical protein TrVFT333_008114 [Trichoderma virens FT-333]|nr:hypothetical protein TrVFT333_008114 [Trichoderma virens FT-333]